MKERKTFKKIETIVIIIISILPLLIALGMVIHYNFRNGDETITALPNALTIYNTHSAIFNNSLENACKLLINDNTQYNIIYKTIREIAQQLDHGTNITAHNPWICYISYYTQVNIYIILVKIVLDIMYIILEKIGQVYE